MLKKIAAVLIIISISLTALGAATDALEAWWVGKPIESFVNIDLSSENVDTVERFTRVLLGSLYDDEAINRLQQELMGTGKFISVELIPAQGSLGRQNVAIYLEFIESRQLGALEVRGNKIFSTNEILQAANLKAEQNLSGPLLQRALAAIEQLYRSRGYERVDVTPSFTSGARGETLNLVFTIIEYDWWIGRPIKEFKYVGLKNVTKGSIDDITYKYLGKQFTKQMYAELESELNRLSRFSLFNAEASRGGESRNDLIITFTFSELPQIERILYEGNVGLKNKLLDENVTVKKGQFLSSTQVNTSEEALKSLYLERGYVEALISSTYQVDEESNLVTLNFIIDEGRQSKVGEILFEGNEFLSVNALKKELSLKVQSLFNSGNFVESKLAGDIQALELAYKSRGYIDAAVADTRIEELSAPDDPVRRIRLVFEITEGEQWFLGSIEVTGNTIYSDQEIQDVLTMKRGDQLDIKKVQNEIGKIADLYWDEGYVENSIDLSEERNLEEKSISYLVQIVERPQATVEEVLIRGLVKTKPYVLERELALKSGDIFSKAKYIQSAQNLYNTGLLTDVQPDLGYGSEPNSLVVTYDVTEGNQMNIGFGATFGGNVGGFPISGFLSWSDTNLGGTGRDLSIMTELAPDNQNVTISFSDDWVGNKRWSNAIYLSFEHSMRSNGLILADTSPDTSSRYNLAYPKPYTSYEQWEAAKKSTPDSEYLMPYHYYQISLGFNTGYTFMFNAGRLSLGVGPTITLNRATYNQSSYVPYDYLIQQYAEGWKLSNRLAFSVTWDGRDLIAAPTKGYLVSQSVTYAGGIFFGLSNYIRTSTSASGFLKIFDIPGEKPTPGVLSLNTTLSLLFDQFMYDGSSWVKNLTASKYEYLYIDGITLARGISPVFYQKILWDNSFEFNIQIAENVLWGEAFISATGVKEELNAIGGIGDFDWYYAAGVGIRLKIPGFPLGLYLVKNAHQLAGDSFTWEGGPIFKGASEKSGLKLVLAITRSLF